MKDKKRVVWSPKHGGCLMTQIYVFQSTIEWIDESSQCEGEYPAHDAQAKRAVRMMNAWLRATSLAQRATDLERRAARLRHRAFLLRSNAGIQSELENEHHNA